MSDLKQLKTGYYATHRRRQNMFPTYAKVMLLLLMTVSLPRFGYPQSIRISYGGTSGYNVPIWVTHEAGLFKKHGLTGELIMISGASQSMQAMIANETQVANTAGSASINAKIQGADAVIIATSYDLIPYGFVVHEDIRTPADLKGKRIAISRFGGITELAVKLAVEKFGLSPNDVTMIQAGPDAQRIPAVATGAVAGSVLAPPGLFAATSKGLRILADLGDLGAKYPTSSFFIMRPYLVQNRSTLKKFLMALIEGLHLYVNDKDFSIRVMQKYTKLGDSEIASKTQDYYGRKTLLVPLNDPEAVKNAIPADKGSGRRPEEFYDNSLIQEIVKEGFVESLKKKIK
jgi:ABC-type nitrate/sulfonate/bicarbonate transport system substrate-binding protein